MAQKVPLFRATTGLNSVSDPIELVHDPETGMTELVVAVNVDVQKTGRRISLRKPWKQLVSGEFHSGYCFGGHMLCVQEHPAWASLYRVDPYTGALSGVRSGLTKHRHMTYCQVNDRIYYSNGEENGYYEDGVSYPWVRGEYFGHTTDKELFDPPIADIIAVMGGFMLLATGSEVWFSEQFDFSAYNLANRYIDLVAKVTMLRPVEDGCWIGTTHETLFMAGTIPAQWQVMLRLPYGVHERACSKKSVRGQDIGLEGLQGAGYLWLSSAGICWGGPAAQHFALTDKRINPADLLGITGTCEVLEGRVIAIVDP